MFTRKKYNLLPASTIILPNGEEKALHLLEAARDIPEHLVKRGDIGGWVSGKKTLSHKDSCWIAEGAIVDSSGLEDNEISVTGHALITGNAYVLNSTFRTYFPPYGATPLSAHISGRANIVRSVINGNVVISEDASLVDTQVRGDEGSGYRISGNASLNRCVMQGTRSLIQGNARIDGTTLVNGVHIHGNTQIERSYIGEYGTVVLKDDCTISGMQIQPRQGTRITICGEASLTNKEMTYKLISTDPNEDIFIGDKVSVISSAIRGKAVLMDNAKVSFSEVSGDNVLTGDSKVIHAVLKGKNNLSGDAVIPENFYAENLVMHSGVATSHTLVQKTIGVLPEGQASSSDTAAVVSDDAQSCIEIIEETISDYESYSTDIIKLLKFPAMVDSTVLETKELMVAIRKAKRAMKSSSDIEALRKSAAELEEAFIVAENRARTLTLSHLDDKAKKTFEEAGQKFAIAANESSTENEKKISFKAGIRSLEGILPLSDEAIFAFKAKVGLLEIEA